MLHSTHARALRVGVDSGGTFTDICMVDEIGGDVHIWKVSSTPEDPSLGIASGIDEGLSTLAEASGSRSTVSYFGHGTTVATNALIIGGGAETGMITTKGFRDVLELRRQKRDALYDLQTEKPELLAKRDKRLEVRERVLFDGRILVPLDEDDVRAAAARLRAEGVRSIAVCFLFSYLEPRHEQVVKRILEEELPDAFVSVSHEVAPEFREYERFSTTLVNAYLGPVMRGYLDHLAPRLQKIGIGARAHLTQSNGGVISSEAAQRFPARTVLSGPAAGVAGALAVGRLSGFDDLITFDMGGTSTDVALIDRGQPKMANEAVVHGYPLKLPMLDIHTVGAGGGSIAHIDPGGLLKVGPRSAAADPGPICYGRGNQEPTVTDANVVLGVLDPSHLLGGRLRIDRAKAVDGIARLANRLRLDVMATAQGIIDVVVANMAKAIRVISVQRGYDPRDYTMLAFGGAGPIHAARLARALDMPRVIVPRYPGIMCALGLLTTDLMTNLSISRLQELSAERAETIERDFATLELRLAAWFEEEQIEPAQRRSSRSADMRYRGQAHELNVPCAGRIDVAAIDALRAEFEKAHRQAYGFVVDDEPIQITTLRMNGAGVVRKAEFRPAPAATGSVDAAIKGTREVWLPEAGGLARCPIYDRGTLGPGHRIAGPAILDQMDSTTLLLPGQHGAVDPFLNLIIEE